MPELKESTNSFDSRALPNLMYNQQYHISIQDEFVCTVPILSHYIIHIKSL